MKGRTRPVPRNGGLRAVRLGPRRRDPEAAEPRCAPDRAAEAAAVLAAHQRRDRLRHLRRRQRLSRRAAGHGREPFREGPAGPSAQQPRRCAGVHHQGRPQGERRRRSQAQSRHRRIRQRLSPERGKERIG